MSFSSLSQLFLFFSGLYMSLFGFLRDCFSSLIINVKLLLLSGNIESNPGPCTQDSPCVVCDKDVVFQGIFCDYFLRWCHPKCTWVSEEEYHRPSDSWFCPTCCLPSFTTSFFESSTNISSIGSVDLPVNLTSVSLIHLNLRSLLSSMDDVVFFNNNLNTSQYIIMTS